LYFQIVLEMNNLGGCVHVESLLRPGNKEGRSAGWRITVQDKYGVLFAVMVQVLLGAGGIAVQAITNLSWVQVQKQKA
jgi:predicted 3-demethylubiquinone-9 3-methyltransferase (glyoxalase superfamily)